MTRIPLKALVATAAFSALLGGCATSIEAGPGYYHYDTRAAGSPPAVINGPAVVYREPAVTYVEPGVVYQNAPRVYGEPAFIYRNDRGSFIYNDHGQ